MLQIAFQIEEVETSRMSGKEKHHVDISTDNKS